MIPEDQSRKITAWHDRWAAKWATSVTPDADYSERTSHTQYSETIVDMSAGKRAEDEYWRGVRAILAGGDPD